MLPFKFKGKNISEKQYIRLIDKGSTVNLKGFLEQHNKIEGLVRFNELHELVLEQKKLSKKTPDTIVCPKCKSGTIIKGKTAYGCANYKNNCDYKFLFSDIKKRANGKPITKEFVYRLLTHYKS